MKWFQQNRALGTLLIVSGVCILLGAALLYWRWSVWSEAKQTFDQATAERNRLQGLNPFPNDANYRKLQGYLERYSAALDKFKDELKAEVAPAPPLAPNEFQSRLRQATLAAEERARTNNVKLPDKFQLGFDEFARIMPSTAVAALLGQELSQVQMLINILLDAKVDSITSFRRRPLPEERGASPTPSTTSPGQRVATTGETGRHARAEIDRAQRGRSHIQGRARCRAKSHERNHKFNRPILHHSHALRAQRKRQRPAARENRSAHASPKPASISRPARRRRAKFHRRQRAHRSLRHDRNAEVYVLTTD